MEIQEDIGADIIFAFDERTSPLAGYDFEDLRKNIYNVNKWKKLWTPLEILNFGGITKMK